MLQHSKLIIVLSGFLVVSIKEVGVIYGKRDCLTVKDCGLGGACIQKNETAGVCDCSYSKQLFLPDEEGRCSELDVSQCKNIKCKGKGARCIPVYSGFYCNCTAGCFEKQCKKCYYSPGEPRVSAPYMAYNVKGNPITSRRFLLCFQYIPRNFSMYLSVRLHEIGFLTRIFYYHDFVPNIVPMEQCMMHEIDPVICQTHFSHFRGLFSCANQSFYFPYDFPMSSQFSLPTNYYRVSVIGGSTRTRDSFVTDFVLDGNITFYSDWNRDTFVCSPRIYIENVGRTYSNVQIYYREASFTLRINITNNPLCDSVKETATHLWKLFQLNTSWTDTTIVSPVAQQQGGSTFAFDPTTVEPGLFRIEVWAKFYVERLKTGPVPMVFTNFGFGYFLIYNRRPEPVIIGGTYRVVHYKSKLILDASKSFVAKSSKLDDESFPMRYIWSCNYTSLECTEIITHDHWFAPKLDIKPGMVIEFRLWVTQSKSFPDPKKNFTQIIRFVEDPVPEIYIWCTCNCGGINFDTIPDEAICLRARNNMSNPITKWTWKCYDSLKHKEIDIREFRYQHRPGDEFVIPPGILQEGGEYIIYVEDDSKPSGQAGLAIKIMDPETIECRLVTESYSYNNVLYYNLWSTTPGRKHRSDLVIFYEFYHMADELNEVDVMFAFNVAGEARNVVPISTTIYLRCCNLAGFCRRSEATVEEPKTTAGLLHTYIAYVNNYNKSEGYFNDVIMRIIGVCGQISYVSDEHVHLLEEYIYYMMKQIPYYFRDSYQYVTVLSCCLTKRQKFRNSVIDIQLVLKISEFLEEISLKIKNDVQVTYSRKTDFSTSSYVKAGSSIITCVDIILKAKAVLLELPYVRNDPYALLQFRKMSKNIENIMENVNKFISRKLVSGLDPITIRTENIIFWTKRDYMQEMKDSTFPHPNNTFKETTLYITPSLARELVNESETFILTMIIYRIDPYYWDITSRKAKSQIVNVMLQKPEKNHFLFNTIPVGSLLSSFILNYVVDQESLVFEGIVTMPLPSASTQEKDEAIDVYHILHSGGRYELTLLSTNASEIRVLDTDDSIPDSDMFDQFITLNEEWNVYYIDIVHHLNAETYLYIGVIPGEEVPPGTKVQYKIKITQIECLVWSEVNGWMSDYCGISFKQHSAGTDRTLKCRCRHLSAFSAAADRPTVQLLHMKATDIHLIHATNFSFCILLSVLFLLFIILFILAYIRDKRDDQYAKVIILEDNVPGDTYPYLIGVYTGNRIGAGTSAVIGFQVYGDEENSRVHILKCSYREVLTRGSDDWFIFFTPQSLGNIYSLYIWSDFQGLQQSWFCSKVVVVDLDTEKEYVFILNQWLTVYLKEEAQLSHELTVADQTTLRNASYLTTFNTSSALREGHLWCGFLERHPRSCYRRTQRLTVFLLQILLCMACLMYWHSGFTFGVQIDRYTITLDYEEIQKYSIPLAFLIQPFLFFFSYFFKKSRSAKYYCHNEYDKENDAKYIITKETERLESYSSITRKIASIVMLQPLRPIVVTPYEPGDEEAYEPLKRRGWLIFVWVLITLLIISLYLTIFIFGFFFPTKQLVNCIYLTLVAIIISVVVLEPIFFTATSFFLGYVLKVSQKATTIVVHGLENLEKYYDEKINDRKFKAKLSEIRSQYCYSPLAIKKERLIRSEMYLAWCRKWSIFDFVVLLMYFLALYVILMNIPVKKSNMVKNNIIEMLNKSTNNSVNLYNITDNTQLLDFLDWNIFKKLISVADPFHEPFEHNHSYSEADYFNRILGVIRLRQQRVKRSSCEVPKHFENKIKECNAKLMHDAEDRSDYEDSWTGEKRETDYSIKDIWKYNKNIGIVGSYGRSGYFYHNGGYIAKFDGNRMKSVFILQKLRELNWLDDLTRVVFIEFSLINVHVSVLTSVLITAENFASGTYLIKLSTEAVLLRQLIMDILGYLITFICLFITLLLIGARTSYLLQLNGVKLFFTSSPNLLTFLTFVVGCVSMLVFMMHTYLDIFFNPWKNKSFSRDFVNLHNYLFREEVCLLLVGMFTSLMVCRMMFFWFMNRNFSLLTHTLYYTYFPLLLLIFFLIGLVHIGGHLIPILLQTPSIRNDAIFMLVSFNFPQYITNSMFYNQYYNFLYPFFICCISAIFFIFFRVLFVYYYAIAKFQRSRNVFFLIGKRNLASVIFDSKYNRGKSRLRGGSDNPEYLQINPQTDDKGQSNQNESVKESILTESRLRKMQQIAIKSLMEKDL